MKDYEVQCRECKQVFTEDKFVESMQKFGNDVVHIRAECPYCRAFVKWQPYSKSKICRYLVQLCYKYKTKEIALMEAEEILKNVAIYTNNQIC